MLSDVIDQMDVLAIQGHKMLLVVYLIALELWPLLSNFSLQGQKRPELLRDFEGLITTVQQPAEWINRDFVSEFHRLWVILGTCDEMNTKRMEAAILVHNWRVSTIQTAAR